MPTTEAVPWWQLQLLPCQHKSMFLTYEHTALRTSS